MITAEFVPASIEVKIDTNGITIEPGQQIAHDYHVPSNYGLITWNGSFLTVS